MDEVTKRQFELGAMESKQWCGEIDEEMGGREEEGRKEGRRGGREEEANVWGERITSFQEAEILQTDTELTDDAKTCVENGCCHSWCQYCHPFSAVMSTTDRAI